MTDIHRVSVIAGGKEAVPVEWRFWDIAFPFLKEEEAPRGEPLLLLVQRTKNLAY